MKRFFKFAISISSLLALSGCPPWVSVNEAQNTTELEADVPTEIGIPIEEVGLL